jgi:hypothetical protein
LTGDCLLTTHPFTFQHHMTSAKVPQLKPAPIRQDASTCMCMCMYLCMRMCVHVYPTCHRIHLLMCPVLNGDEHGGRRRVTALNYEARQRQSNGKSGHLDLHFSTAVDLRLLKKMGRGVHWRITRGLAPIFGDVDLAFHFSVAHRHVHEPAPFTPLSSSVPPRCIQVCRWRQGGCDEQEVGRLGETFYTLQIPG